MKTLAAVLAIVLAVVGFATPPESGVTEITLKRGACFGRCPAFKATLRSDGTLTYQGEANVEHMGVYRATIGKSDFARLVSLVDKLGFWRLKANYNKAVMDVPHYMVGVKRDGRLKEVRENGAGPDELWAIEALIDKVVDDASNWEAISDSKNVGTSTIDMTISPKNISKARGRLR